MDALKQEIRNNLTGPVASIRTPFLRDGRIDYAGLRRYVDFSVEAGSPTMLLTWGDSLYTLLTDEEIAEVTRVVCEQTAGRAMVVAAERNWGTPKLVEFARYAKQTGAGVLMVMPPDWAGSCTTSTLVDHYAAAAAELPVMIITATFVPRGEAFGLETLKRVRDEVPGGAGSGGHQGRLVRGVRPEDGPAGPRPLGRLFRRTEAESPEPASLWL